MSSKACLYNLLVVADDEASLGKMEPLLNSLLERFPGKLVTLLQKKGDKLLKSEIKEPIALLGSKAAVEPRVALEVAGFSDEMTALLPLPHLVPDFPVLLFWLPDVFDTLLFETFYKLADRLLIDGEEAPSMINQLSKGPLPVVDLAWCRGEGWRGVIREVFSSQHRKKSMEKCVRVDITYAEGLPSSPLFFQAWLAASLKWQFKAKKGIKTFIYLWNGREIEVHLSPKNVPGTAEGSILDLKFTSSDNEECHIFRGEDALEVKVHICTPSTCDLPFTLYLPNPKRGGALLSSWIWGDTKPEMLETLPLLERILG